MASPRHRRVVSISAVVLLVLTLGSAAALDFQYHNYKQLEAFLKGVAQQQPDLARVFTIGKSCEGRELWAIELSSTVGQNLVRKPNVKLIGNIHGDEVVGREVLLHFVDHLASNWLKDAAVTQLLNTTNVYILPSMNPDGYERRSRGNCNGIDLNRSFPEHFKGNADEMESRQPETRAIMQWLRSQHFALSLSLHGGALLASIPWDGRSDLSGAGGVYSATLEDDMFQWLGKLYANAHLSMNGKVTNGAEWYPLYGGMQDYNYVYYGVPEITCELSVNKQPAAAKLPSFWNDNKPALMAYANAINQHGIRGRVLSDKGHKPVEAWVRMEPYAQQPSTPPSSLQPGPATKTYHTNPLTGDYFRIAMPGRYKVTIVPKDRTYEVVHALINVPLTGVFVADFYLGRAWWRPLASVPPLVPVVMLLAIGAGCYIWRKPRGGRSVQFADELEGQPAAFSGNGGYAGEGRMSEDADGLFDDLEGDDVLGVAASPDSLPASAPILFPPADATAPPDKSDDLL